LLWCRGCTTSPPLRPLLPSVHGAFSSTAAVTAYRSNTKNEISYAIKVATQIKQYKDRILLHLPSSCPVKALLHRVTALLSAVPAPLMNTS
jgi:hypothetical protein